MIAGLWDNYSWNHKIPVDISPLNFKYKETIDIMYVHKGMM